MFEFKMAKSMLNVPFYSMGIEVGSDAHLLTQKMGSWKPMPGFPSVMFTRCKGLCVTVKLLSDGSPSDIAVYPDIGSKEEFDAAFAIGDAIYRTVPENLHGLARSQLSVDGLGAFLINALKELNLWDQYILGKAV